MNITESSNLTVNKLTKKEQVRFQWIDIEKKELAWGRQRDREVT